MARKTVRRYYHDERLRFAALETKKGALEGAFLRAGGSQQINLVAEASSFQILRLM
jgi:hypothetical protein